MAYIKKSKPSTNLKEFERGTGAGKGDTPRFVKGDTYRANHEAAFTRPLSPCCGKPATYDGKTGGRKCPECGEVAL